MDAFTKALNTAGNMVCKGNEKTFGQCALGLVIQLPENLLADLKNLGRHLDGQFLKMAG